MRNFVIVSTAIIVLGLTTFAGNYYGGKMHTMPSNAVSEALPAIPARDPCTCSCGKDCAGNCTFHVTGCGVIDGILCILDCCTSIPKDCSGELQ